LPQQQTIRDLLDAGVSALICRDSELTETLAAMKKPPALVITDSQAFGRVSKIVPKEILLTSFSILFARYKGDLRSAVRGAAALDTLEDGDKVLISEGCTHHRQCGDIGTVKLPAWIREYSGKQVEFEFTSGKDFPESLEGYKLVVHCGGCMLTEKEMQYRGRQASDMGVPMTNYGMVIAHTHGILRRSLEVFPEILDELK
jgi:[FeFe] hydrogenase H-cluster maturation GTPase HydF